MPGKGFISVKNFERFQHYKDRNPPWIKLHAAILDDYHFGRLHDASKMHLIGIWILASKTDNRIPCDPEWIGQRIGATAKVDLEVLVSAGFLLFESGTSTPLASRKQKAPLVEESREEESREETEVVAAKNGRHPTWLTPFSQLWTCGTPPFGKLSAVLKPLIAEHGEPDVLTRWTRYLVATEPKFWSVHRFSNTYNTWDASVQSTDLAGVKDEPKLDWVDG